MIPHLHPHAGDCEHACCLKIEHLSVRIGGEAILDDINLHMHCGQMVALIGPNTLLKRQVLCRLSYWVRSKKFCAEYEIKSYAVMAGTAGFEPANVGVKGRCLTAWRRPRIRLLETALP